MPMVQITNLETANPSGDTTLFDPFNDPITLRFTVAFGSELAQVQDPVVWSTFEIIEFGTNQVVEFWRFQNAVPSPGSYYDFMTTGTADALGLKWLACGIFGLRCAAEIFSNQGESGLQAVDAMDVSDIHWFRFMPLAAL